MVFVKRIGQTMVPTDVECNPGKTPQVGAKKLFRFFHGLLVIGPGINFSMQPNGKRQVGRQSIELAALKEITQN